MDCGRLQLGSCNNSSAGNGSDRWTVTQVLNARRVRYGDETSFATAILLQVKLFAAYKRLTNSSIQHLGWRDTFSCTGTSTKMTGAQYMQCNCNVDPIDLQSGSSGFGHVVLMQSQMCRTFATTFMTELHIMLTHCGVHCSTTDETTTRIAMECLSSSRH